MKRWWPLLAAVNGIYALGWLVRAGTRVPLWYDELFTVRLSAIPATRDLWRALLDSFDFNPPGLYLVTRIARLGPVADPLGARLPALVGVALLMATMFVFLRRRVGAAAATAAVALIPLSNFVGRYAIEARAYMLVLGVSGCALLCWQSIGETGGRRRILAASGLAVAIAFALTLHVWSIILPAALLAGEAAITVRTGRIRWIAIVALAAAAPTLALYPALLAATKEVAFTNMVYSPTLPKLLSAMLTTVPRLRALAILALGVVAARVLARDLPHTDAGRSRGLLTEERIVLAGLVLSPVVPYAYAAATSGAFMTRYALFVVIGVTGLLADVLFAVSRRSAAAGTAAAVIASVTMWIYLPARVWVGPDQEVPSLAVLRTADRLATGDVPVVLVNPLDPLAVDERATDRDRRALTFVADPVAARRYTGADLVDFTYLRGERYLHIRIPRTTYTDLTAHTARIYLLGEWQPLSWIPQRLKGDGWTLTRVGGTDAAPLYEAVR
ncbi:MAG: hypothetical protein ABI634_01275 [Acidobacteriota bacterium]